MRFRLLKKFDVHGHDAISVRVTQSWFKRFFNLEILMSEISLWSTNHWKS